MNNIASVIQSGRAVLGLELGSTRIKCVLIGEDHAPIASGDHTWENRLENGVWTYHMDDVWAGIQDAYAALKADVESRYGVKLTHLAALGVSAMMHGYLPFDKDGKQLCEFRTWRNTMTADAAEALTSLFDFNIPQRWSIAHLYQAILNGESHLPSLARLTTLAGHVHYMLTGRHVMGVGEASGMFPIDSRTGTYDARMVRLFDDAIASKGYGECFGHSLGHGFGLEVHEAPNASTVSTYTLESGMTITVEPGIYIEGLGGVRIEDCCIMTEDGYINPVTSPKELIIIE